MEINKDIKAVREALKNNTYYVYHMWDAAQGYRARICDVRTKAGKLQVKHLQQGIWATLTEDSRLLHM